MTLDLFPNGRWVLTAVANATLGWAGIAERRLVTEAWYFWLDVVFQVGL